MQERALERVVLPLSGLSSWLVVIAGVIMALQVLGINVQPLLTVTGVSGLIVGLSAQSVMANMISGVNLVRHAFCMQDGTSRCSALLLLPGPLNGACDLCSFK